PSQHERSLLAARCVAAVLVGAARAEACVVCAEPRAWAAGCGAGDWQRERCASFRGGGEADAGDDVVVWINAWGAEGSGQGGSGSAQGAGVECTEPDEGFSRGEVDGQAVPEGQRGICVRGGACAGGIYGDV